MKTETFHVPVIAPDTTSVVVYGILFGGVHPLIEYILHN